MGRLSACARRGKGSTRQLALASRRRRQCESWGASSLTPSSARRHLAKPTRTISSWHRWKASELSANYVSMSTLRCLRRLGSALLSSRQELPYAVPVTDVCGRPETRIYESRGPPRPQWCSTLHPRSVLALRFRRRVVPL